MNYIKWLNKLASKEYSSLNPSLTNIAAALKNFGNPQNQYPVIHIAGTNGKGSTARLLFEVLKQSGYKTALYTSPHLLKYNERIRVNNNFIKDAETCTVIKSFLKENPAYKNINVCPLTYFELITLIAFKYFELQKVDIAVIEVGLGGRFDATNTVEKPLVSVITTIDYDHMELLGNNIKAIAKEKAGIIKPSICVVSSMQIQEVQNVLKQEAGKQKAKIYVSGHEFGCLLLKEDWEKNTQQFNYIDIKNKTLIKNIEISIMGAHQLINAGLALKTLDVLKNQFKRVNEAYIRKAFSKVFWPARLQVIKRKSTSGKNQTIIIDGAHNPNGLRALILALKTSPYLYQKPAVVTAVMKEKKYFDMMALLSIITKRIILYKTSNKRAVDTNILYNILKKNAPEIKVSTVEGLKKVFEAVENHKIVIFTGSLYFCAEVLEYLGKTDVK
ncbi:MAG: hypothetical protein A2252_10825 [Elusimicrobia bacterium RIFOXYA2_FULL_39_19]|nr:MAG: hypothetical protein A2252_10825 [Elusimicrobia bacterium RIFOXYA2_FULL_39_19]